MLNRRSVVGGLIGCIGSGVLATRAPAQAKQQRTVRVEYHVFPGMEEMDGNFSALKVARDGRIYVGLVQHGGSARLVYFDPKTYQLHDLGDMTWHAGESHLKRGRQSKIHTRIGEGPDGRMYFGTDGGYWFNWAQIGTKQGYPGAHWMAYDPKTDRVENFGLAIPNYGFQSGDYEPRFHRIYAITAPHGNFVYYDVAKRKVVDKGRVNNWESLCRAFGFDEEGNVYGTFGRGQIFKYDPRTDTLRDLPVYIPIREKGISLGRDYGKSETGWRAILWDAETRRFYGVEESATILFSFDPKAGKEGETRALGQLCVPGTENSRNVAYASLGFAMGRDRKLYYTASEWIYEFIAVAHWVPPHLMTYAVDTGKIEDLGVMTPDDGRRLFGATAGDTAADGTIHFVGSVEVHPEPGKLNEASPRSSGIYYRLALITYQPRKTV